MEVCTYSSSILCCIHIYGAMQYQPKKCRKPFCDCLNAILLVSVYYLLMKSAQLPNLSWLNVFDKHKVGVTYVYMYGSTGLDYLNLFD